jgi:hypothetical protein
MTEIFDTSSVRDDDAHWQALAERVTANVIAGNDSGRIAAPAALWVGVSLAFAASLALMIFSGRPVSARDDAALRVALAPADDVGRALALPDAPPKIGDLVLGRAAEGAP